MGKGKIFLRKRKAIACLLAVMFLAGEFLQPVSFLRAEESTISGIEISVVTIEGEKGTALGNNLEKALTNLEAESGIQLPQIKELVITSGKIGGIDWLYISNNREKFSSLTDFRAEENVTGTGGISDNVWFPESIERVELPNGTTFIARNVFGGCSNLTEVTIPGSVKAIQEDAFNNHNNLMKVNLSEGLETIGARAFEYCYKLEQIRIPDSVTQIGNDAFFYCMELKEVILSKNLITIGREAFSFCTSLLRITIPDHVTSISVGTFRNCRGLKEVIFPESLESIGSNTSGTDVLGAFENCINLTKMVIPGNVKTIGKNTFSGYSSLEEVVIEEGVETIGSEAFEGTAIKNIVIPGSVLWISDSFRECHELEKIIMLEGPKSIGDFAFWGCDSLLEVTIPASVASISSYAFRDCLKLSVLNLSVKNEEEVTAIKMPYNFFAFEGCPVSRRLYFYTEDGLPLSDTTVPTFSDAVAAYRAVRDNNPTDDLWWGCQMEEAYSVVSHLTNLKGSNAAAAWRDIDGDYTTTLTPAASAGGMVYTLPAEIVVKIGGRTALPEDDYTYDPATGTLLIKETSIDGNIEIEAAADESLQQYKITVETIGNGKVRVETDESPITIDKNETQEITVSVGDQILLSLLPDEGASLVSLIVDGEEKEIVENEYSLTDIQAAHIAQVVFTEKVVAIPSHSPNPTKNPEPDPTPTPDPTPPLSAEPTLNPTPTPVLDKDISDISDGLGVTGETAQKIQEAAKELDVSKDTILVTDSTITSQKTDDDIKGAYFARIQARTSKTTQKNIKLVWNKVKGADGYLVYGNRCNTKKWIYEYKLAKTITNRSKCSYIERKCKKGSYYKFIVRAYKNIDGKKVTIAVSKTIHVVTDGGKNGNAAFVKVNKGNVSLKKGKKFRIKAKEIKQKKKLQYHRKVCYESSNPKVASVSKKGVVKAKKKGKCTIYAYAQSGIYKKVKVTVK